MWHFTQADRKLRYDDNRVVEAGKTLSVEGKPQLCDYGLHASKNILDACNHAPGPFIWWVELSGTVIHGSDKSVATKRKAIWGYDATEVLREFSRIVALQAVLKYWDEKFGVFPDVVKRWLETGDESLRFAANVVARSAADAAAGSAADAAAWSAANAAAWSAWSAANAAAWSARSAARSAAWSAARSAAWSAARSAAWSAAGSAAGSAGSAADAAAWSAANAAAWSANEKLLVKMIRAGRPKKGKK